MRGDDQHDGVQRPVKSIGQAIRLAQPGDTIHLQPVVYRDWAAVFDKSGEPDRPITLDGHGATLDGCDPLNADGWVEESPGLFRHDDLLPLTDAIIDRWFFLWNGQLNRMHRCSKGPSEPLKSPEVLLPGEWTFVKDAERTQSARKGYIHGSFYLRLPPGQSLAEARIEVPVRSAGVLIHGQSAHWIVRNLTAVHPHNDGFNLSECRDAVFENIRAMDCGDDGISAHGDCRYSVHGFTSMRNATGICDTGNSETSYRHVLIRDCIGFDLFFLDTGRYSIQDAVVLSSAAKSVYLLGREKPAPPCCLTLENVLIRRQAGVNEIRVSPNCRLSATRTSLLNLDLQAVGGDVDLQRCHLGGMVPTEPPRKPQIHLWPEATWRGRQNVYDLSSLRSGSKFFAAESFDLFQTAVFSERLSQWASLKDADLEKNHIGADVRLLQELLRAADAP
jgi:hypothetical protein